MFRRGPITLILTFIGASFIWMLKGFKGKFDDEMTRQYDTSFKSARNWLTGLGIVILIVFIISRIAS